MRHVLAVLLLLALLLFLMVRNVAPDPYVYDEADYMYAASLGFIANYTDTPALPVADFVRTGLARGRDASQRQALSEQIRASDDVVFYRHWHGPLYIYLLIPASRLGLTEQQVRTVMLAIPALILVAIYCGCLWLIPGRSGTFAALAGSLLFLSSKSVTGSTELAPHQLFALLSVAFLFLLVKFVASGQRLYCYVAVVVAGLAFCTLEVAFVLIITLVICAFVERRRFGGKSLALFVATVLVVWPAAIYKLSFVKGYLFMAYLALFRKSPWGTEGFFEIWGHRVLDSPLEWAAILASVVLYLRKPHAEKLRTYPLIVYAVLMLAATARVVSSSPRYSLLFMPALDTFAALTLVPFLAASPRRVVYAALAMFCGFFAITEYRLFHRNHNPDARPPAVLSYIHENRLEEKSLLVPQEDLPMIHYYFPRMHLHGYNDPSPPPSGSGILYRGYPVRMEYPR
jgi:Dolichyl-phosphate-mannose-protein mannosyltransferase